MYKFGWDNAANAWSPYPLSIMPEETMNTCWPSDIFDPDVDDYPCMPTMLPDQKFFIFRFNRNPREMLICLMSLGQSFRRVVHDVGRIASWDLPVNGQVIRMPCWSIGCLQLGCLPSLSKTCVSSHDRIHLNRLPRWWFWWWRRRWWWWFLRFTPWVMTFMSCGDIPYLFILLGMIMNLTNKLRNKVTMHDQHFMLNDHVNNHKRAQQYFVLLVVMINLIIHDRSITFALLPMRHMQCVTQFVCRPAVADNKLLKHIVHMEAGQVQLQAFSINYLIVEDIYEGETLAAILQLPRRLRVLPMIKIATFTLPSIMNAAAVDACFDIACFDTDWSKTICYICNHVITYTCFL